MSTYVLCSPHSLGVVLSRGHGEYILLGNTTVEEGGSVPSTGGQCGRKMDSPGTLSRASLGQSQSLPGPGLQQVSEQGCLVKRSLCVLCAGAAGPASMSAKMVKPKTCHCGKLCWTRGGRSRGCVSLNRTGLHLSEA